MIRIGIVTHVWAEQHAEYAAALRYQMASLCECAHVLPLNYALSFHVCCCESDTAVQRVIGEFYNSATPHPLELNLCLMPRSRLGVRANGRNEVSLGFQGDYLWYTDVDHVFAPEALLHIPSAFTAAQAAQDDNQPATVSMIYPNRIWISSTHQAGAAMLERAWDTPLGALAVSRLEFVPKRYHKAIGGVQIVRGDFARQYGYLNDSKWLVETDKPFSTFRDDVAFRHFCMSKGVVVPVVLSDSQLGVIGQGGVWPVGVSPVYRIRHIAKTY